MNYTLKSELGEGGMATVYLAEDHKFHTDVAVKMLKKEFVNNENIRKRFIAEARKMFKMSHPNIIKVTDLIEEVDTVAFVMEYIEGETLKQYIERKGKLSDGEIKDLFTQMLDAVGYVHEQNLVHRDIKPSNFMVDQKGKVKLMDFGIAKILDPSLGEYTITGTNQSMGTPMYMSPEQITETKSVSSQSDIYSLGVVLWQMVTGQKPYDIKILSNYQLQTKIVNEKLPITNSIFDVIIEEATAKNLDNRYKNCNEVKVNLVNLQKEDNESTKAYTSQNSEKTIIETAADKTIVEKTKQTEILSPPEIKTPYNPPVKKSNLNILFIILGILLIIGLGIAITNKSNSNDTRDDTLGDTTFVDSLAADTTMLVSGSKTESFINNLSENNHEPLNFNGLPFVITPIKINPNPEGGSQNVFFNQNYTLFDQTRPNDPIFPVNKNGKIVYQIYYSSNEDPEPYYGEFTPDQLESHLFYKFKNKETCQEFCRKKKAIIWQGQNDSGFVSVFKKISSNEWIESNNDGNAYFYEVKYENGNYTLKDKNREGVFVYLTSDRAYYKDNNTTEWLYIYYGQFK